MLLDFLRSSYKQYKDDTNAIATWLTLKAKQCGYPADLLSPDSIDKPTASQRTPRLKGKARKLAKEAAKSPGTTKQTPDETAVGPTYTIKVKDFIPLAEFIASFNKPVVKVPSSLASILDRAIALRREHGNWHQAKDESTRSANDHSTDENHHYFLGVLERTREILKPRMPATGDGPTPPKRSEDACFGKSLTENLENKFTGLDIEEPSQAFLDAPELRTEFTSTADPKSQAKTRYQPDIANDTEEQYFAQSFLFQDVRDIRAFICELWSSYKLGFLDLAAVSLTTNTAINLIRDLEEDFVRQFPSKAGYKNILKLFFIAQCILRGENPNDKQQPGDLFNFAVYDLVEETLMSTYTTLSSLNDILHPTQIPVYKPGYMGSRDTTTSWGQKTPRQKFKEDQLILFEAFPDLVLLARLSKSAVAEDELLRGVRDMAPGKLIPLWLVFAARVFLDIQHVMEDEVDRAWGMLTTTARYIKGTIEQNMEFHQSLRIETWPRSNDLVFKEMLRVVQEWVLDDVLAEKLREPNMPNVRLIDSHRLFKQHPLLCGLYCFVLKTRMQDLSVTFVNAWGSVMYTGHLYNACRQEGLLMKSWKDMETVISMQSTERFFVGDAPEDAEGYFRRFLLNMGYSASNFARNRRNTAPVASANGPRGLAELGAVGHLLADRYCNNAKVIAWTMDSIKSVLDQKLGDDENPEQSKSGALLAGKPKQRKGKTSTVDFLEFLANALHAEAIEISIDYLMLHRFCWRLLRSVNDRCKPQISSIYGGGYLDKENQLPHAVGYILMTATNTSHVAGLLLPRKTEGVSSRILATAAQSIEDMIDSGAGEFLLMLLRKTYGFSFDLSAMEDQDASVQSDFSQT